MADRKVTTIIWAVSALCIVTTLNGFEYKRPSSLNKIMFSGEVMPIKHLNAWRVQYPDAMFVNLYGPTEITCNCTYYIIDREFGLDEKLPMGKPFANERVFLLDDEDKLVDAGRPGELGEICVSGTAVTMGYLRNPEKTAAAFVQNPLMTDIWKLYTAQVILVTIVKMVNFSSHQERTSRLSIWDTELS